MQVFDKNRNLLLDIPVPREKFKKYLEQVGNPSIIEINLQQTRRMFVLCIKDFKKGKVSLDELSTISCWLYSAFGTDTKAILQDSKLGILLSIACELNYKVRYDSDSVGWSIRSLLQFSEEV